MSRAAVPSVSDVSLPIELEEQMIGGAYQIVGVWQIVRSQGDAANKLR